jgi:hypothetical protein
MIPMTQSSPLKPALPAPFFFVVDALGVEVLGVEVLGVEAFGVEAGNALNFVVVIVATTGAMVVPDIVDAGIVLGDTSTTEYDVSAPMTTLGLDPEAAETVVVVGSRMVSVLVDPGKVEGGIVVAGIVLPGRVVV